MSVKFKITKDILLSIIITFILGLTSFILFIPLFLIYPVPSITLGVKYKQKYSLIPHIFLSIIFYFIFGNIFIYLSILAGIIAYISSKNINKKKSIRDRILKTTLMSMLYIIIIFIIYKYIFNYNVIDWITNNISENFDIYIEQIRNMNIEDREKQYETLVSFKNNIVNIIKITMPSILFMISFLMSSISNIVATYILRKNKIKNIKQIKISRFRINNKLSLSILIMFFLSLIIKFINKELYQVIINNLLLIFIFLSLIQGIGVLDYFLKKFGISNLLRVFIIFMSLFLTTFLSIIGLLDLIIDFRRLERR